MNKKIKKVVKNYEEKMKFESRFESLSQKLDLIKDDTPIKSDVIIIKRRLVPAYLMSMLVVALITGIIGLQIGLSNLKLNTEYINPVTLEIRKHTDKYLQNSVHSSLVGNEVLINYYLGSKDGERRLLLNISSIDTFGRVEVIYNSLSTTKRLDVDNSWIIINLDDNDYANIEIKYIDEYDFIHSKFESLEIKTYFEFIDSLFN